MNTTDRNRRAEEAFFAICELPPEEWTDAVNARCAGDEALLQEVRSLLECHVRAEGFLDGAEIVDLRHGFFGRRGGHEDAELRTGTKFGEYVIEGVLGAGGMGTVYVARQERPSRTVALKVVRRGYAGPSLLRRFEHEAEMLGRLHHPGIAQIFEAGSASVDADKPAQPYIAMELVRGQSLTEHCARLDLTPRERMELIAKVCDAVHHAHQRGVIHRDLKPANILVDERGQPKILDFGVARAADADLRVTTMQTSVGQLIGTLPYMSPEQVTGDPGEVDTRSDVYALGVLLFQLLTGKLPHDVSSRSLPEAARIIREEAPSRLSAVSRVFRGDVETIVSQALEKDKARRYQSAADLAEDLRRHIAGLPIMAKEHSALYVLAKQLRRNKVVVAAGGTLLAALLVFSAYAWVQAGRMGRLADRETSAREAAQTALKLAADEAARANEQAARLQNELWLSMLERGRLEGVTGNVSLAEDMLWRSYLARPKDTRARWALWELYERHPCRWTRVPTPGAVRLNVVALSNDGVVATIAADGTLVLLGARAGDTLATLGGALPNALELRFTQDGRRLVGVGWGAPSGGGGAPGCNVVTWSVSPVADGRCVVEPVARFASPGVNEAGVALPGVELLALAPDGAHVAYARAGGGIEVRRTDGADPPGALSYAAGERLMALAVSNGGTLIALASESGGVRVLRASDGAEVGAWHVAEVPVWSLEFTPDAGLLLAGSRDRALSIIDLAAGTMRRVPHLPAFETTRRVAAAPSGEFAISAGESAAQVWSLAPGGGVRLIASHAGKITDAALSADAGLAATVGPDGRVRLWEPRSLPGTRRFEGHKTWAFEAAFHPQSGNVASGGGEGTVRLWTRDGRLLAERATGSPRVRFLRFSPDGSALYACGSDGTVHILDPTTLEARRTFVGCPPGAKDWAREVASLAFSPDGSEIVVGGYWWTLRVYDAQTLEFRRDARLESPASFVKALLFSRDGKTLYCNGSGRGVCEWSFPDLALRRHLPTDSPTHNIALAPGGESLAAGTEAGRVIIFDLATGERRIVLDAHSSPCYALGFSPSGRVLATGGDDGLLRLWDPTSNRALVTITPRRGECASVAFAPGGHEVFGMFRERVMMSWNLLHYNLHIAGNLPYQLVHQEDANALSDSDRAGLLEWARLIEAQTAH
ncbi:MAG: protein kinase [Planctomycetota bacterium]|nr:protein kinase [Planctomycetota bacterium]